MRSRRSNRPKSYTVDSYDYGDDVASDEDVDQTPSQRRQRKVDEDDDNFHEPDAPPNAQDAGTDDASEDPLSDASGRSPVRRRQATPRSSTTRQRAKPVKATTVGSRATSGASGKSTYFDLEPFVADTHMPKGYAGSFERHLRGELLASAWYGPDDDDIRTALDLLDRWIGWPLLPPREPIPSSRTKRRGVWDRDIFKREEESSRSWHARLRAENPEGTILTPLLDQQSAPYHLPPNRLPVLMGPRDSQEEISMTPAASHILSPLDIPLDDGNPGAVSGWILDAGGVVLSLDWASQTDVSSPQYLALAVIPHSDQQNFDYEVESSNPDFQASGIVQIWELQGVQDGSYMRPAPKRAFLRKTLCIDSGRVRTVKWAPASHHIAIISGGKVEIVEPLSGQEAPYVKLEKPLASLSLDDGLPPTAITWVNLNRLAVGYTDGSIALWSIYPCFLLSRHATHNSPIIDISSGYPTLPNLIASTPISGYIKLIDIGNPSCEATEVPSMAVYTIPNLLSWSDHLKGYMALSPSSNVLNSTVGFFHHSGFPIPRRVFIGESLATCLSVGRTHPYLLIGSTDGSLIALNSQTDIFQVLQNKRKPTDRLRVFQHEHRPVPDYPRGVSRVLRGFRPEQNRKLKIEVKDGTTGKPKKKRPAIKDEGLDDGDDDNDSDDGGGMLDPSRTVIHEPLTKVTAVEWNPNDAYGCWAAAALGSGLVKVMDLGLDR